MEEGELPEKDREESRHKEWKIRIQFSASNSHYENDSYGNTLF
jgi:hypothetical protein